MYYGTMKTFKVQLQSKINEFLSGRLSKMDTQSEEFWAESNARTAFQDGIKQYHNSNSSNRVPRDRERSMNNEKDISR